jgi:hypothetical protein
MDDPPAPLKRRALPAIFWAGSVCGVLDISYVLLVYGSVGASPVRIFQGIAGAVLGRDAAFKGGPATAALGLALHFAVAFGVTAVFYLASRRLTVLVKHAALSGVLYGIAVWLAMNLVVLPLTAQAKAPFPPPGWEIILFAHVTCVGPPIALIVRRFSR